MRIVRTDLVNFMIDDLVESSLGFLKRKKKKEQKKEIWRDVILQLDIAFVLLKSILYIIYIVDCIVWEYIIYIYIYIYTYNTREAITGNKTAGNNNYTIS